ncbi:antileukoproteinase-like isoform 3-T4 [Anomaloglossus baeobatrachus]|uniref:antileukoproteinase-like isoform X3 n=1 Tax=Anomaloglossus baeobatrachus TaxID=238106 RepID=UPI003F50600A
MSPVKVSFLLLLFLCSSGYPTAAVSSEYTVKLGNCPEEYPKPDCELRYFPLCDNDYECPDSQKCCEEDCQQKCTYPIID